MKILPLARAVSHPGSAGLVGPAPVQKRSPSPAVRSLVAALVAVLSGAGSAHGQTEDSTILTSPPALELESVLDSLTNENGRVQLGDVEYAVQADPRAKGGVGLMVSLWPDGEVPFVFHPCTGPGMRSTIQRAMDRWESVAPVSFVEATAAAPQRGFGLSKSWSDCERPVGAPQRPQGGTYQDFVLIMPHPQANASCVGQCGGQQELFLADTLSYGIALHELGHALGMSHEHVRSDRDQFVQVLVNNIARDFIHNFALVRTENCTEYDFGSIMHYGPGFFSVNGQATLIPYSDYRDQVSAMGNRDELTQSDIQDVNTMYGGATCTPPGPGPGVRPTVTNPRPTTVTRPPTTSVRPGQLTSEVIRMTSEDGEQHVIVGPAFDVDAVRAGWSRGLNLVTGAQSEAGTVLVMARDRVQAQQRVIFDEVQYPEQFIRENVLADDPSWITGAFAGPRGWTVIASRAGAAYSPRAERTVTNFGWTGQSIYRRDAWEPELIRERWDDDRDMVDVAHGPEGWISVFSEGTDLGAQGWNIRDDPREIIRERWDDDYSITDLEFGDGQWHVVATRDAAIGRQRWVRDREFPTEAIRQAWSDGMHVQALDYGAGWWYVVFSQRR